MGLYTHSFLKMTSTLFVTNSMKRLAPPTGLEPVTYALTVRRSTDWTTEAYVIL